VSHVKDVHPSVSRSARRPGATRLRTRRPHAQRRVPAPNVARDQPSSEPTGSARRAGPPRRDRGAGYDRGLGLLITFTVGMLVMVALISLTAIIARWWMLGPVMAVDLGVTAAALAMIVRLLHD